MKRKVKYKNFDRILTVALLGITVKMYPNQNVPKSKCTFVETKFTQVRSKLTQVESKRTQCVAKNVPMIIVLLQFVYKLIEIMYSSSWRFLTLIYFEFALHD